MPRPVSVLKRRISVRISFQADWKPELQAKAFKVYKCIESYGIINSAGLQTWQSESDLWIIDAKIVWVNISKQAPDKYISPFWEVPVSCSKAKGQHSDGIPQPAYPKRTFVASGYVVNMKPASYLTSFLVFFRGNCSLSNSSCGLSVGFGEFRLYCYFFETILFRFLNRMPDQLKFDDTAKY